MAEGLGTVTDLPHTITQAVMYRSRIDSFYELPRDKRPPRYMWDRPHELSEYLEHVWDTDGGNEKYKQSKYYEYDPEGIE